MKSQLECLLPDDPVAMLLVLAGLVFVMMAGWIFVQFQYYCHHHCSVSVEHGENEDWEGQRQMLIADFERRTAEAEGRLVIH